MVVIRYDLEMNEERGERGEEREGRGERGERREREFIILLFIHLE